MNKTKREIISSLLALSIALGAYGCDKINDTKDDTSDNIAIETTLDINATPGLEKHSEYINKMNEIIDLKVLNNSEYRKVQENDNRYTLFPGANIYFKFGFDITDEMINDRLLIVSAIEANDTYTLVTLPNGEKAYVNNNSLIKCANLYNSNYITIETDNDSSLMCDAYLYDSNGMYIGYLYEMQPCYKVATNGEYTLIRLPDGIQGYVLDRSLNNNYRQIDGCAFVRAGTSLYSDKNLINLYRTTDDEMVYVEFICDKYAGIFDEAGRELLYVNPSALDDDFILVDLNQQKMNCYLDYQLAGSWGTRSGKDSTPTHEGAFDIDTKVTDWEFTTYPGSRARYWIPISPETQEGIHDLIGDDEWNYGNEAYHNSGSHGCIRVPAAASEFVYNNYNVGDMVLVRKK